MTILFALVFYICRFSPFLPRIDWNEDGSFLYENILYVQYEGSDFVEKFGKYKRGKKIAVINENDEFPLSAVYEVQGNDNKKILIVHEEIIMSIDTYYTAK